MLRFALPALLAAALLAQNPDNPFDKPPAGVDEALRARMEQFFQLHVTGEYRKAESLVSEETKDWFYEHNKPKYLSFEIRAITYSENFTKAKATVVCEQIIPLPGFAGKPMKVPSASDWKLVDGKWYWYVPPEAMKSFPFGKATITDEQAAASAKAAASGKGAPAAPGALPSLDSIPTTPDFIMNKMKADKTSIDLKAGSSATVTFQNTAPGTMSIKVIEWPKGVEISPASASLKTGESAALTVKATDGAKSGAIGVLVSPTNEVVSIKIAVQ
jgi:hypothetical protein